MNLRADNAAPTPGRIGLNKTIRGYAIVGLYAPKMNQNVAGAVRAAYCYGANHLVIEGARYHRATADTQAAFRHMPVIHRQLVDHDPMGCTMIAVDLLEGAVQLNEFKHPERAIYIFGPEDGTIPAGIVAKCSHKVFVPTRYCMNLASAVNVVLYDRQAKQLNSRASDASARRKSNKKDRQALPHAMNQERESGLKGTSRSDKASITIRPRPGSVVDNITV